MRRRTPLEKPALVKFLEFIHPRENRAGIIEGVAQILLNDQLHKLYNNSLSWHFIN